MKTLCVLLLFTAPAVAVEYVDTGRTLVDTRCEEVVKYTQALVLLRAANIPFDALPKAERTYAFPAANLRAYINKQKATTSSDIVSDIRFNCYVLGFENLALTTR